MQLLTSNDASATSPKPAASAPRSRSRLGWAVLAVALVMSAVHSDFAHALTDAELLDATQERAFDYFWNEANPSNGLIKDRSTSGSPASIAAVGFGLSAICVGIDHGWITRAQGRARVLTTLQTFWNGPQGDQANGFIGYNGLFYHFLDMATATRTWSSELSSIDTALLIAGIIDARQYFDTVDLDEVEIRNLAGSIIDRVDWNWMRASGVGIRMGWVPGSGFDGFGTWVGYNEAMVMYILALGSSTHPIPSFTWFTWTSGYNWATEYGQTYVVFPPLFGHQYSHCWIDYRNIHDVYMQSKGITYFENSRRATYAAQAYCVANPGGFVGYGENLWGLTASDGPFGYSAHGAPPAQNDDGTITPTAAASSIAFAPEIAIPALQHMYNVYGPQIWSTYGFKDAFNPTQNWVGNDYLGIDQGPIVLMIENYLNQSVWNRFMQDPIVAQGLAQATFTTITAIGPRISDGRSLVLQQNSPNPFSGSSLIRYRLAEAGHVSIALFNARGRRVQSLFEGTKPAGDHSIVLDAESLPSGLYYYRLLANGEVIGKPCVLVR